MRDDSQQQHDDTTEPEPGSAEPEAPLNRAERRARKKGAASKSFGKLPPTSRQSPVREGPSRAMRQWANRRSG